MKHTLFQHFGFSFNREKRELYKVERAQPQPEEPSEKAEVQQQSVEGHIDTSTQRAGRALAPIERSGMSLDQGTCEQVCQDLAMFYAHNRKHIRIGSRMSSEGGVYKEGQRRDAYVNGRRFEEVYLGSLYVEGETKGLWMDAKLAPEDLQRAEKSLESQRAERKKNSQNTRNDMLKYQREFKAKRKAEAQEKAAKLNALYDGLHGHGNAFKNGNRHLPRFVNPKTNAHQTVVWRPGIGAEAQQVESTGRGSAFNGPDNRTAQQIVSDIDNQYEEKWAREDAQRAEEKMNAANDRIYEWAEREGDWLLEKLGYLQNLDEFDQSIVLPDSTKGRGMLAISNMQNRAVATVLPTAENGERVYKIRPNNGPEETIVIHDKGIALKQLMSRLSQLSKPKPERVAQPEPVRSVPTPPPEPVEPAPVVTEKPKQVEESVLVNKKEKVLPSKEVAVSNTESTYLNTDRMMQTGLALYKDLGSVLEIAAKIMKENKGKSEVELQNQFKKEVDPVLRNVLRIENTSQEEMALLAYFFLTHVYNNKNVSSLTKEEYTQMLADFLDEYKTTGSNYIDPLLKTRDAANTVRGKLKRWTSLMWKGIKDQKKHDSEKEPIKKQEALSVERGFGFKIEVPRNEEMSVTSTWGARSYIHPGEKRRVYESDGVDVIRQKDSDAVDIQVHDEAKLGKYIISIGDKEFGTFVVKESTKKKEATTVTPRLSSLMETFVQLGTKSDEAKEKYEKNKTDASLQALESALNKEQSASQKVIDEMKKVSQKDRDESIINALEARSILRTSIRETIKNGTEQ